MEEKESDNHASPNGHIAGLNDHISDRCNHPVIDLLQHASPATGIHSLESIAHLKRKKAEQLLSIELERLRILNGRMCRIIDRFLAQRPEELGPLATRVRNEFVNTLSTEGIQNNDVYLKIGRSENVEGSLYIAYGCEIIRYRWDGTDGPQHVYLNNEGNFLRAQSSAYVSFERFQGVNLSLVFDEEPTTRPLSRMLSAQRFQAESQSHEQKRAASQRPGKRLFQLLGLAREVPREPAEIVVKARLSPEDNSLSYAEHAQLLRALGIISTGMEQTCSTIQSVWASALAADDQAQTFK